MGKGFTTIPEIMSTEVDLATNDYVEIFIKTNNANTNTITLEELQFKLTD